MEIKDILSNARIIAVVGLSPKEERPSHKVAAYLKKNGYQIIPVNPGHKEILGEKCYPSLLEIPSDYRGKIDIVDVFRRVEETPNIVRAAAEIGAKVVWLQEGIVSEEARAVADSLGLKIIMDRCILKEHLKNFNG